MRDALSIDLEEWYHPYEIQRSGLAYDAAMQQAPAATHMLLEVLRRYGAKATFFTVGEVAQAHPRLIQAILNAGHELAFHGWTHTALWNLTRESFSDETARFLAWRDANFPGVAIEGYRAPTFSLDARTAWAVEVLQAHGFAYDASIFPARTTLYGVPEAPRAPYCIRADALTGAESGLLEVPMSVFSLGGLRAGFTGGLYLKALPLPVIRGLVARQHAQGIPAVFYVHPWETYPDTPRLPMRRFSRLVLYTGMGAPALRKLERLLQHLSFDTLHAIFLGEGSHA